MMKNGATKEQLKLLPSDHPALAMAQQWNEISVSGQFKNYCRKMYITQHTKSAWNHESNSEDEW